MIKMKSTIADEPIINNASLKQLMLSLQKVR
nr:MAG TPA: hypothetical protein [Caudoviricetes sp.]